MPHRRFNGLAVFLCADLIRELRGWRKFLICQNRSKRLGFYLMKFPADWILRCQTMNVVQSGLRFSLRTFRPGRRAFVRGSIFLLAILVWVGYLYRPSEGLEITAIGASAAPTQESTPPPPFHVKVVYSPGYLIDLGGLERLHPFDIRKYQKIYEQLKSNGTLSDSQTSQPEPLTTDDLLLVHSKQYLDELKDRKNVAKYLEAPALINAPVSMEALSFTTVPAGQRRDASGGASGTQVGYRNQHRWWIPPRKT